MVEDYEMNDSGHRSKFDSGAVREDVKGKGRMDLISPFFLQELAVVMEKGCEKYSDRNWEKGMPLSRYIRSAYNHIIKELIGETDENHPAMAGFNIMAYLHTKRMIQEGVLPYELDDMPHYAADIHRGSQKNPEAGFSAQTDTVQIDKQNGSMETRPVH
jgi:hypothetical protein